MAIKNRYEFVYFVECIDGNPNGDPDAGNMPRIDPQDMRGLISDVAVKRRIRNYVQYAKGGQPPYAIIVQESSNINRFIALAHEQEKSGANPGTKEKTYAARQWICNNYFDVRSFGAVLSTGPNAGQVRGPVQLSFLRSIDPVLPMEVAITRMATAESKGIKDQSYAGYVAWEEAQPESKLRTMGRKQMIPFGLYCGVGFVSAFLAEPAGTTQGKGGTGFDDSDLELLWEAILNMYEHDRSASKGVMSTTGPIIVFKHVGTDSDPVQRVNQAKLGCAPAQRLFELVAVERKADVDLPRSHTDYRVTLKRSQLPAGVEVGLVYPTASGVKVDWNPDMADDAWLVVE